MILAPGWHLCHRCETCRWPSALHAGLVVDKVVPITVTFHDAELADKVLGLHHVTALAVDANYLTGHDARQWLHLLATEPFFASATLFVVAAS